MPPRILIVDDEEKTTASLVRYLRTKGYDTAGVCTYDEAVALLHDKPFDLLINDFVMPANGGVRLAKYVNRLFPHMGIITISAMPTADLGRELIGVSHAYVDKQNVTTPLLEAISKVRTMMAGAGAGAGASPHFAPSSSATSSARRLPPKRTLDKRPLYLNFATFEYRFLGQELDLSPEELWVLTELGTRANEPINADHLASIIAEKRGKKVSAARVRAIVHSLRQKLEPQPSAPRYLQTKHRSGYVLVLADE